jgi:homoserine dehydrogenase
VESLIPAGLDNVANRDEFLCNLPTYDNEMEQKRLAAEKAGKVVRFVGSVDILRRLR